MVQDDERSGLVHNFHIPALKRNTSSSVHREQAGGNLLCTSCIEKHQLDGTAPICIVLADQNFPPILPTAEGLCTVILRIEDAILGELPDLLTEYFGRGRASVIPENSLVLFGSVAHLAQRGLSNYVKELVRTAASISAITNERANISHYIYMPLGGVTDAALVRDLLDLDAWLSTDKLQAKTLPDTRALLWETIVSENLCTGNDATGSRRYYLPESLTNSRKCQFSSPALSRPAPAAIAPFDSENEHKILTQMLAEIGTVYGIYGASQL